MKTKESIRIDFNRAVKQASIAGDCADDLRMAERQLRETIQELSAGWKGEAASVYLQKCEALAAKINKSARQLDKISSAISQTAKTYYEAEKAALEVVNTKSV